MTDDNRASRAPKSKRFSVAPAVIAGLGGGVGYALASRTFDPLALVRELDFWITMAGVFVGALVVIHGLRVLLAAHARRVGPDAAEQFTTSLTLIFGLGVFGVVAWIAGDLLGHPPLETVRFEWAALAWAGAALVPLFAVLGGVMLLPHPAVRAFRDKQYAIFEKAGLSLTPVFIVALSLAAGVFEEMLFRGFLQPWIAGFVGIAAAIAIQAAIFGLFHALNIPYFVLTTVAGAVFGVVFVLSGNLLSAILAHAVYDVVALGLTAQGIAQRRAERAAAG